MFLFSARGRKIAYVIPPIFAAGNASVGALCLRFRKYILVRTCPQPIDKRKFTLMLLVEEVQSVYMTGHVPIFWTTL